MDRAQFEFVGNVGKLEIKSTKDDKKVALISLATTERWKSAGGERVEKTYWHRVAVFAPAKVALIEAAVQIGTRLRLVGQVRPTSWEDERGAARYGVEFVVTAKGELDILARPRSRAETAAAQSDALVETSKTSHRTGA